MAIKETKDGKERVVVEHVETEEQKATKSSTTFTPSDEAKKKASSKRMMAALLWAVGIVFEIIAVCILQKIIQLPGNMMIWIIVALILDMIAVLVGSSMWKKANRLDPASEQNKVKFFLWNNLGAIMAVIAFFPLVILLLTNKDMDKKSKTVTGIIAVIAMAVAVGGSYDWSPVSSEQLQAAKEAAALYGDGSETTYWAKNGEVFHFNPDCSYLMRSTEIIKGNVEEAFEENKTRPCSRCAEANGEELLHKDSDQTEDTTE